MNHGAFYYGSAIAALHHSSLQPIYVPPPKGQTVYSSKTKSVHPFESLPLQQATFHFLSLCFKGLAPWELLLLEHDCKQALQFSARQPTPSYWRILSHCETLRASNLENKQNNITLYRMMPYTNTPGVELMACEHHSPKLNAKEVLRNLLWRLKIDYEFFSWRMEVALLSLCDCVLLSPLLLSTTKHKASCNEVKRIFWASISAKWRHRKDYRINC